MKKMANQLKKDYNIIAVRNVRGDGNCYYRSVYYAYFELIIRRQCLDELIGL